MSKNKLSVALAMIARCTEDELAYLDTCLASVCDHVDAIYVDFNGPAGFDVTLADDIIKKYKIKADFKVWEKNFVKARTEVFDRVAAKYDWILWLDVDDTVENPEKIKEIAAITSKHVHGVHATYDYDHDAYGNVTTTHPVARLVRNDKTFRWQSSFNDGGESVHETLVPVRQSVGRVMTDDFKIIHHAGVQRKQESLQRNIELLEAMYARMAKDGKVDPRILYYLGTHYFDALRIEEARQMLVEYLELSGWAEERSEAWVYIGLILEALGESGKAEGAFIQAIREWPDNAEPYVELAQLALNEDRKEAAESWLKRALETPKPKQSVILHPQENTFRVFKMYAKLYAGSGATKLEEAKEYIDKALKLRPYDPECQQLRDLIDELVEIRDKTRAIARVGRLLRKGDDGVERAAKFLDMLPDDLQDNPVVVQVRQAVTEPKKWPKKSMVVYVGESTLGTWGPGMLKNGCGMSEEAVIQLTQIFAQKYHWKVVVYGTPGSEAGEFYKDPVGGSLEWRNYWEFNGKDKFDVLVAWRSPWVLDYEIKARKKYLWLHDVIEKEELDAERMAAVTKVIFVSQFHADLYKDVVPPKKVFVSGNGIEPWDFKKLDGRYERKKNRMLYMSAHERGLEVLYDVWPEVKAEVPNATLDVYYGWQSFDSITKDNPERQAWKQSMIAKEKKLDGVINHGRISTEEIAKEICRADILAYPCTFPEVYCATLIKAMAGGLYPVTSDFAVMKDFNTLGVTVPFDRKKYDKFKEDYKLALIEALKGEHEAKREVIKEEARLKFSWAGTADGWLKEFE